MGTTRVGFIGLGKMGAGMAARLAGAGFPLVVYDIRAEAAARIDGAKVVASPRDVATAADVICTSLPGPSEAEEVFFGSDGVLSGLRQGALCIDFTTNAPRLVRRIATALGERGAEFLDAPVSGGVEGARNGQLTVLVGGSGEAVAKSRPLLDVLATKVLHVGEVGAASVCKVLHNCAVFVANLATVECLTAGVKAGVPAATLVEVFQASGLGRNLDLQVAMPATLFRGNFEPRYFMRTALKDMSLATELAREYGAAMELADVCERDMREAVNRGWSDKDNTIFLTLREERAGAEVRME
jgi:3-hydroxyisobutyrate dehydrogenase